MKTRYSKILHSCVIALFSLSLVGSAYGDAATVRVYENMIATALAKPTVNDKIDALNGIAGAMGGIDADTAKEINPEFTAALTSVYTAGQGDATARLALYKLLGNALQSTILSTAQQATVAQWQNALDVTSQPQGAAPSQEATTNQVPKALDVNAMQQLASTGPSITDKIAAIEKEENTGKALEGVYNLLQESQHQSFPSDVQEKFGRLVVKIFNDGSEITAYLHQVLHEIVDSKTPLLATAQIDYVNKEMLPRVDGGDATTHTETHAATKEAEAAAPAPDKDAKKDKKKLKKNKDAKARKAEKKDKKGKKSKKDVATDPTDDGTTRKEVAREADADHSEKARKKDKAGKKDKTAGHTKKDKKGKKGQKAAAHTEAAGSEHAGKTDKKGKKAKKIIKAAAHTKAAKEAAPDEDNAPVATE